MPCIPVRREEGLITVKMRWKEYAPHVLEEEAYKAVEANTSGSRPKVGPCGWGRCSGGGRGTVGSGRSKVGRRNSACALVQGEAGRGLRGAGRWWMGVRTAAQQ